MTDTDRSLRGWEDVYEDYRPLYTAFVEKLERVIRDLLYDADVAYEQPWSWTYDLDDFYAFITEQLRAGRDFEPRWSSTRLARHFQTGERTRGFARCSTREPSWKMPGRI
jgi:hypothetical protein